MGLNAVSHVAGKNVNLPILGNVLIKAEEKSLRLVSTNLEIAIMCIVRGKVEEVGEFTVPSKLFSDYVSLLPKERVDASQEGNAVSLACGAFQTKLHGIPASEFPLIPTIEAKDRFSVGVEDVRKAIGQVLYAVAPNESRPEISGVLFKFAPKSDGTTTLTLAATDSYRLAERSIKVGAGSTAIKEPVSIIVPSRTVAELVRILGIFKDAPDAPKDISIQIGDNQVLFAHENVEIISRTIEGKYPDYRSLVPDKHETEVTLDRNELARAVRTTSLFSKSGLNDIQLKFAAANISLSAVNSQTGENAVTLDGKVTGKDNAVTVNFKYFLDGVNNVETSDVVIQMVDATSPCIIRSKHGDKVGDEYLYLVMPIRQ
ncbi:MAG: polymerase beta subunit [Candidatus Parcubacteria bacterium]|jgi:DNA polymerase-3 subunit beta